MSSSGDAVSLGHGFPSVRAADPLYRAVLHRVQDRQRMGGLRANVRDHPNHIPHPLSRTKGDEATPLLAAMVLGNVADALLSPTQVPRSELERQNAVNALRVFDG